MGRKRGYSDVMCDHEVAILEYIKKVISECGYPPSVREICKAVGLKSTSSVHMYLARLAERGEISKDSLKTRALRVPGLNTNMGDDINSISIPLVGQVAAGEPILAEQNNKVHRLLEQYKSNLLQNVFFHS